MRRYIEQIHLPQLMKIAHGTSLDSTCLSRKVGCLIVTKDPQFEHFTPLAIAGYNDMPKEFGTTCGEQKICRCFDPNREKGKDLDKCYASHAEVKAIGHAARNGISLKDAILIVTDLPCNECAKLVIESGIKYVAYDRDYPHSKAIWMFEQGGVKCERIEMV